MRPITLSVWLAAIVTTGVAQQPAEQAAIARRYRDEGHPQFWGRITGTSGDAESAGWMADGTTRAYAKIIDGVNALELKDLQRPSEVQTPRTGRQ